jgi:bifunctional UDP-N-acetylglucosamine pyrophosphorylase/glucosamine-1-phosphate N-acetyltransferase
MEAVIMAAGRGVRMGELTNEWPKPMLPVGEGVERRPILEHSIRSLPDSVDRVVVVVNHLSEKIEEYFGNSYGGREIVYVKQPERNGTGGALACCREVLEGEKILVISGDSVLRTADLERLINCGCDNGMLALRIDDPRVLQGLGVIEVDERGYLVRIKEKPKRPESNWANGATYLVHRRWFEYPKVMISKTEWGLPQALARKVKDHPVKVVEIEERLHFSSPEDLDVSKEKWQRVMG